MQEVHVDFVAENGGVWAIAAEVPGVRAFGGSRDEALSRVLPMLETHCQAIAATVTLVEAEQSHDGPIENDKLRALAKKYPPPASWYDEETTV